MLMATCVCVCVCVGSLYLWMLYALLMTEYALEFLSLFKQYKNNFLLVNKTKTVKSGENPSSYFKFRLPEESQEPHRWLVRDNEEGSLWRRGRGSWAGRGYAGILLRVLELNFRPWGIHLENMCQNFSFSQLIFKNSSERVTLYAWYTKLK